MVVTQKQLQNLKPFTKENAAYYGRKGGLKKSMRKKLAVSLNPVKHGKYVKNQELIENLMPTPEQKAKLGWTFEEDLQRAKEISSIAGARTAVEAMGAWLIELAKLQGRVIEYEKAKEAEGKVPSPYYRDMLMKRQEEFLKNVWGLNHTNINIKQEITEKKISFHDVLLRIVGEPDEDEY